MYYSNDHEVNQSRIFNKVQILGPFTTGTNLLYNIINVGYETNICMKGCTYIWKHTICDKPEIIKNLSDNVLKIVMVRDPYFWLQSLKEKKLYTLETDVKNKSDVNSIVTRPCKLRGHTFESPVHLWNYYYKTYLEYLPKESTIWISYEKFLFEPRKIIGALSRHLKMKSEFDNSKIIKIISKPSNKRSKGREEALNFNKNLNNRKRIFNNKTLNYIESHLDKKLLNLFYYQN
tara:strand:- start:1788 stop:2486 length:699 start_codon:yes stop_codon:yes gene_type:complete